jgi:hypothetical protein
VDCGGFGVDLRFGFAFEGIPPLFFKECVRPCGRMSYGAARFGSVEVVEWAGFAGERE